LRAPRPTAILFSSFDHPTAFRSPPLDTVLDRFLALDPSVDFWSLRVVDEWRERLAVRRGVLEPPSVARSVGAMVSVVTGGGSGYAATSDLSGEGLAAALEAASDWARRSAGLALGPVEPPASAARGGYRSPVARPWEALSAADKVTLLGDAGTALRAVDGGAGRLVDWEASLARRRSEVLLATSHGAHIEQTFEIVHPGLAAVANEGAETQARTLGAGDLVYQGGLEHLERLDFAAAARQVAEEALALLAAPDCPNGVFDLVILPGQMATQVHESIGHPLELDRILGDERNYAGGSFVTLDLFGRYRYGSELLNVVFDPGVEGELASYRFDDEGTPAERAVLIRDGILERPLGGALSQRRANLPGTASARACDWNRPPIDRMANVNLAPGESPLEALVGAVEDGLLIDTNRSWSIDSSRNKFQFGCEYGRRIREGRLAELVRNPSYRGRTTAFWRSLAGVGDAGTVETLGIPGCGKGEPNQTIGVGHATPACLFRGVSVFSRAG